MAIQQQPSHITKSKNFMELFTTMYSLFLTLLAFVYVEITGFADNFVEKNLIVMRLLLIFTVITFLIIIVHYRDNLVEKHLFTSFRFSLILLAITFLIVIIPDLLRNPPVRLLQIMVFMVMSCAVCVLLVALVSTLAAVIVFIVWMVGISIVALQRWTDIVRQMKEVRNVVAN